MCYFNCSIPANLYTQETKDELWVSVWTQQTHWTSYSDRNSIYYLDPLGSYSKFLWDFWFWGLDVSLDLVSRYVWTLVTDCPVGVFGEEPEIYLMQHAMNLATFLVNSLQV